MRFGFRSWNHQFFSAPLGSVLDWHRMSLGSRFHTRLGNRRGPPGFRFDTCWRQCLGRISRSLGKLSDRLSFTVTKGTQDGNRETIAHASLNPYPHEKLRLLIDVPVELFHDDLHFAQGHTRASADMDDGVKSLLQECSPVHQWVFESPGQCVVGAVFAVRFSISKKGARISIAQHGANIVKANVQKPRSLENAGHGTDAL